MVIICVGLVTEAFYAPPPVISGLPNGASAHPVGERQAGRKGKKKQATRMLPSAVKTSCGVKATIVTTQMEKPKRKRCPACGDVHIATGSNDNPRLSDCKTFISRPVEERAEIIAATGNGCVICLDYSGSHRAGTCQAKDEQGKKFEPCKQLGKNGSPCDDWHNPLLHGSTNHFCNSIKKKD